MLDGQGDRRAATDHYQQAVTIFRETGDQWALTHPLCDLALRTWDAGHLHQAMALLRECLAVFRQLRSHGGIDMVLGYLTFMAVTVGDLDGATRTAEEKAEIGLVQALQANRAYGLHSLAHVNLAQGRLDLARQQLESALPIALAGDNHGFKAEVLLLLGRCAVYAGAADEAAARLAESQRWDASAEPAPWREAAILFGLGQVACLRSDFAGATARYQESLHLVRDIRQEIRPGWKGWRRRPWARGSRNGPPRCWPPPTICAWQSARPSCRWIIQAWSACARQRPRPCPVQLSIAHGPAVRRCRWMRASPTRCNRPSDMTCDRQRSSASLSLCQTCPGGRRCASLT